MKKIFYSFCIKDEFKIYKDVCNYKEGNIRNYSQWREHIMKYNSEDEQYNINFYHFIINEKKLAIIEVDIWSIFIIPLEVGLLTTFFSIASDFKLQGSVVIGTILGWLCILFLIMKRVDTLKLKVNFFNDVCCILFNKDIIH